MVPRRILLRKVYRLCGIIFPLLYLFFSKRIILTVVSIFTLLTLIMEVLKRINPGIRDAIRKIFAHVAKPNEEKSISGTTYFLIGSLAAIIFFERGIAIASLCYLVVGDAAAAIGGMQYGRIKIGDKSLEGSLFCLAVCLIAGFLLLNAGIGLPPAIVFCGAVAATLIELLPVRVNDNLTVALGSGLAMSLFKYLIDKY